MFNNKNKTILLTGTAGFIGSNFVPYFLEKYPNYNLVTQLSQIKPNCFLV